MPRKPLILKITFSERKELEEIINNEASSTRLVQRCKIILLTENGVPLKGIAEKLGVSRTTANTWRQIYLAQGIEGLKVKKRVGRPSKMAKQILSRHFPGLVENLSLSLRNGLDLQSKSAPLLSKEITCN